MSKTNKESRNTLAPVAPQASSSTIQKTVSEPSTWGPLAIEPGQNFLPPPAQAPEQAAAPAAAPRRRKGRTMAEIVARHKRPDGKRGFTFRDLCPKLHVAAESLRAGIKNPGRFSVSSVVALAELMGEDPMLLLSDILAEMKSLAKTKKPVEPRPKGIKPPAEEDARSGKKAAKPSAQKNAEVKEPGRTAPKKKSGK